MKLKHILPFTLITTCLAFTGCDKKNDAGASSGSPMSPAKKKLAFVTNGVDPFWNTATAGVRAAEKKFGVSCEVLMPPKGVVDQKRMIESLLARGVDGIAMTLMLLTTLLMPLAVLGGWTSIREKIHSYYALLMVLTTGMLGVFMALDLMLFFVMWELMLVPMYLIIGVWGGQRRLYASLKFFLYTMSGSMLMLVGIIYLGTQAADLAGHPSFSYDQILHNAALSPAAQIWLFIAFAVAFAVKVPMFPFHTWLPDAHVEAPTAGSVILAAIMLKMGTFGFLRYALPLFPGAAMHPTIRGVILTLAVVGIVYGALVALVQPDFKKLVAYSSVSHLGFVMLGIFALTPQSVQGALMVNLSHGVSTGALFLMIGMIYERRHTRLIADYGGIAKVMPIFAVCLTIVALSSIGVPPGEPVASRRDRSTSPSASVSGRCRRRWSTSRSATRWWHARCRSWPAIVARWCFASPSTTRSTSPGQWRPAVRRSRRC